MEEEESIPRRSFELSPRAIRLALVYLLVLSVAMFRFERLDLLAGLAVAHLVLYAALKLDGQPLVRILRRLSLFFLFILLVNAVQWSALTDSPANWIDDDGLWTGLALSLRVLIIVVASTLVRLAAPAGAFADAIRAFGLPRTAALAVDGVFELIGSERAPGSGRGKGRGQGGGDGRGGGRGGSAAKTSGAAGLTWSDFRNRRLDALFDILRDSLDRSQRWIARRAPDLSESAVRDASLVLMTALAIMSVRFLQILPGLPIAPGHKNLLIVPLYLFVAVSTRSRFGATQCGLAIGLLSFLFGQGRFGVFEVLQWLLPGVAADLMAPFLRRVRGVFRWPVFAVAGLVLGVLRFSAGLLMILLAGGHPGLFAIYLPFLLSQAAFATVGASLTPWLTKRWTAMEPQPPPSNRGSST